MNDALYRDSFSYPFIILSYLGHWPNDWDNPVKKKLFNLYRLISMLYEWHIVFIGWIDLYLSLKNFKKVIYNLCVTTFTTVLAVKNVYFVLKAHSINNFRLKLFTYTLAHDDEDLKVLNWYRYNLKIFRSVFFFVFILIAPLWLLSSLLSLKWGPRELPFPFWLPLDLEDDFQFGWGFFCHTMVAIIFVARAIHSELAMFSLILQATAHYKILGKDLMKINDFYTNDDCQIDCNEERKKDINKFLTRVRVKKEIKNLLRRQMEMKECVKEIEYYLHQPMLLQLFGGLMLSVLNGFQLIEATMELSFSVSYQIAYTLIVLVDIFVCCLLCDNLTEESNKINNSLYNLMWYEMDTDIAKDIMLMIVAAQRVERITAGKFFTLNLATYLGVIKNLYSWLTMFRTVAQKNK